MSVVQNSRCFCTGTVLTVIQQMIQRQNQDKNHNINVQIEDPISTKETSHLRTINHSCEAAASGQQQGQKLLFSAPHPSSLRPTPPELPDPGPGSHQVVLIWVETRGPRRCLLTTLLSWTPTPDSLETWHCCLSESQVKGPASRETKPTDIVDEAIYYFKANVFFKNYEIKNEADRTLICITL